MSAVQAGFFLAHDLHCTSRRIVRFHADQGLFPKTSGTLQEQQDAVLRKQVASYPPPKNRDLRIYVASGGWLVHLPGAIFGSMSFTRLCRMHQQLSLP